MAKNKIGWCNVTWNPVIGCKNNCEYCYARRINQRFKFTKDFNIPEWREESFNKTFPKKPQRIFVGSMSEIYYWEILWTNKVINKIKHYPQHTFQFLTKYPDSYIGWNFPKNCWLGITVTQQTDKYKPGWNDLQKKDKHFISFEPLLEEINLHLINWSVISWVIIGAETGNRKGKIIPEKSWVKDILWNCDSRGIPVYVKDNLIELYPVFAGFKGFPK